MRGGWPFPANRWLEPLLAFAILAGLARAMLNLWVFGYLPQPYFYDANDMWADWFNTAYWSYDGGAYDTWQTIYPPLSFVFLKAFSLPSCYARTADVVSAGYAPRDCDWLAVATFHGFYLLNIVLIARTYIKLDRETSLWRAFALAAGLPMTDALERGNLIIVAFTCVLIAYGPLVRSARWRWLAAGLAVNFKVYLIASVFPQLLRRRWRWFEGAMLATIGVFAITYAIFDDGSPLQIYRNIGDFTGLYQAVSFLDLWYSFTYTPLTSLLQGSDFPVLAVLGSDLVERLSFILPLLLHIVQGSILLAAIAAWLRPEAVPMHRLTFFGIAFALITSEAGGYTQVLLILFVFMEPWRGIGRKWAIVACYVLCIPGDIVLSRLPPLTQNSFLAGHPVVVDYAVAWGPFFRPGILLSLPFALACVTLREVGTDIGRQGWKTRWRYRRDLPILAGAGTARPPVAG